MHCHATCRSIERHASAKCDVELVAQERVPIAFVSFVSNPRIMGTEASRNIIGRHLSLKDSTDRIHDATLTKRPADHGQFHHGQLWDVTCNAIENMHHKNGGRVIISFTDHDYRTWQVHVPLEHISLMQVRFNQTYFNANATPHTHLVPDE